MICSLLDSSKKLQKKQRIDIQGNNQMKGKENAIVALSARKKISNCYNQNKHNSW